jgi:hypothetical protein
MDYDGLKITAEVRSSRELNCYLNNGWVLILSYIKHQSDSQQPCFIVGWKAETEPVYPELLDEWEKHEMEKYL